MKIIAIIPARSGSKGIPRKNIVDLCGKPLIAYSICAAQEVSEFGRIFVSTDCEEIKSISEKWGVKVPFLRPRNLAEDNSKTIDVVIYIIEILETKYNEYYDYRYCWFAGI